LAKLKIVLALMLMIAVVRMEMAGTTEKVARATGADVATMCRRGGEVEFCLPLPSLRSPTLQCHLAAFLVRLGGSVGSDGGNEADEDVWGLLLR
jgi:hypothetical protein